MVEKIGENFTSIKEMMLSIFILKPTSQCWGFVLLYLGLVGFLQNYSVHGSRQEESRGQKVFARVCLYGS